MVFAPRLRPRESPQQIGTAAERDLLPILQVGHLLCVFSSRGVCYYVVADESDLQHLHVFLTNPPVGQL